ncbi:AAA family ATPase [Bdellovibrionota bacterium FG-2]
MDEAQKAPDLFDALKLRVDQDPRPGQYLILGSAEFSTQMMIRESLTGRLGRVRLFPMCYRELRGLGEPVKITRSDFMSWSEQGGFPGIAFVRSQEERRLLFEDWLQLVCYRDIQQFKKLRLDGDLAFDILRQVCLLEEPSAVEIARKLRQPGRRVQTHLLALEQLFAIQKIAPHPSGAGKPIYLILDAGLAHYFGAEFSRRVQVLLMNELLCHWGGRPSETIDAVLLSLQIEAPD